MRVYTYSEARQNLATVLDRADEEGEVRIRRRDGREFVLSAFRSVPSPLDVEGVQLDLTADDILGALREVRSRAT